MKIVVYEHFTSGALQGDDLPAELAAEGDAMLQAMVGDMLQNTPLQPLIMRDSRLLPVEHTENHSIQNIDQHQALWQRLLANENYFLLIAPETDGILQQLAEAVIAAGKTLLGSLPSAIALSSDKLRCSQLLQQHQLATIATQGADDWLRKADFNDAVVCKPNDGAGCVDTYYFQESNRAREYLLGLSMSQRQQQIVQPFLSGKAMSLSLLIDKQARILSLNQQTITINQQITYQGSIVGVAYPAEFSKAQAQLLADNLLLALPGLSGFIGVDIILCEEKALIVDVNPRLTTSFNQLTQSGISPATMLYQSLNKPLTGSFYG